MACCDKWEGWADYARRVSSPSTPAWTYCPWCGLSIEPIPCPWPVSARAELSNAERQGRHTVQWEPPEKLDESGKTARSEDVEPF